MPIYECLTTTGTLDPAKRKRFAEGLTKIHCEETGAPPDFVHVLFPELPEGASYTAGRVGNPNIIRGTIRKGRSQETRESILHRACGLFQEITGATMMSIVLGVSDIPPHWAMEGGVILPEPTQAEEDAWFEKIGLKRSELPSIA